ncbi:MAG: glycosyltransferase, partial [Oscillatoria sp. PMC 1076.18]|nr:glycosyltransferase [Oscillatoria sp. PMC 1076.18]
YNGERTIKETIESVLNQTWTDFELIVINDGSTDSSLQIISEIQDSRIVVFSYPNTGLAASRNRGIEQATGNYLTFLDADDLWTPDKLADQLEVLQENPQAGVAYSWTDCIDEQGKFLRRGSYVNVSGNVYANVLLVDFLENGSNVMIRRQALEEVGGFDESLPASQDWDMWLRLAAKYEFVAVSKPQVLYRISSSSMSSNVKNLETACLRIIERSFSQAPESLQYLQSDSLANIYKYLTYKVLQGNADRQRGKTAAKFLLQAIKYDRSLLRARVLLKVWLQIAIATLLPSSQAQKAIANVKNLSKLEALLGYIKLNP